MLRTSAEGGYRLFGVAGSAWAVPLAPSPSAALMASAAPRPPIAPVVFRISNTPLLVLADTGRSSTPRESGTHVDRALPVATSSHSVAHCRVCKVWPRGTPRVDRVRADVRAGGVRSGALPCRTTVQRRSNRFRRARLRGVPEIG